MDLPISEASFLYLIIPFWRGIDASISVDVSGSFRANIYPRCIFFFIGTGMLQEYIPYALNIKLYDSE